jgi:hypothetical protein
MHGDFRSTGRASAPQVFGPERASLPINPCPAGPPSGGPVQMTLQRRAPLTLIRATTLLALGIPRGSTTAHPPPDGSGSQSAVVPDRGSDRIDHRRHRVSPIKYPQDWRSRLPIRLPQQFHRPGRFGPKGLAGWQQAFPTIQLRWMGQIQPRGPGTK